MELIKKFVISNFGNNSYLIKTNEKYVLIDVPYKPQKIIDYLEENGILLDYVIITHTHFDHILGLQDLYEQSIIKDVYVAKAEIPLINDNSEFGNMSDMYGLSYYFAGRVLDVEEIKNEINVDIIYINGHSKASAVYIFEESKTIFSGDVIFNGTIGRYDLAYGNRENLINGIKNEIFKLSGDYQIFCGHGFKTSLIKERSNPLYKDVEGA